MVRRLAVLLVPLLLVLLPAAPAWAVSPFGPPVAVVDPVCSPDSASAEVTQDSTGHTRGFVNLWGSTCNTAQVITYIAGTGASWSRQTTPYRGFPVATAWDSTATYLLYVSYPGLALKVAKRTAAGAFSASTTLSTTVGSDGSLLTGDIVASGGRWWAVWREHVKANGSAGDEFDQTDLFQAYTFGGSLHGRQRITTNPLWDGAPALTIRPGPTYPVKLVWTRGGSDFGGSSGTDLMIASATTPGVWSSKLLASAGINNFWPDIAATAAATYVTWNRDGRTVAAVDSGSGFTSKTFGTSAVQQVRPRIVVAAGTVAVGWTSGSYRTYLAERVGTTWTGVYASPSAPGAQRVVGVGTWGGRSRALTFNGDRLIATTES